MIKLHQLWRLLMGAMLLFSLSLGSPAGVAAQEGQSLTVVAAALNMRSGPGLSHPAIEVLLQGQQAGVVAYEASLDWWQIRLPDGRQGWVSGGPEYVSITPAASLPEAADPLQVTTAGVSGSQFVAAPGRELGGTLVFQTAAGGPIYAFKPAEGDLRYLTHGLDPVLSPDGRQLAFTRWQTNQNGALGNLWVIGVDGSGERAVLDDVRQPRSPTWSADGSRIILNMQHGGRIKAERVCGNLRPPRGAVEVDVDRVGGRVVGYCYTLLPDPQWGLRQVNLVDGTFQDLPNQEYSFSPAWDPANPWRLIYDGNRGLVALDLNRNVSWPFSQDINDRSPVFSPDGSKIALSYWQHDHWEVHVMNSDGSGRIRLTETPYWALVQQELSGQPAQSWDNAAPTWSPDGSKLAFLSNRRGSWEIWVMNGDGSEQGPLLEAEALPEASLQYNGVDERMLSWR